MKILKFIPSGVVAACLVAITAHAVPITGDISFNGKAQLNGTQLLTATRITSITGVTVLPGSQDGTYASVPGGQAVWFSAPIDFTSAAPHAPAPIAVTPFWSFTYGGLTYSFDLTSIGVAFHDRTTLSLYGDGMAHVTGFDDTASSWTITETRASGGTTNVTFGHSVTLPVPDESATAALLGLAVGALVLARCLRSARTGAAL